MLPGKCDEIIHIWFDGLYTALHCGDGIALPTQPHAASHHGAKLPEGNICRATAMHACKVGAEHEYFIGLKPCDTLRCELRALHSIVHSHIADKGTKNSRKSRRKPTAQ